MLSQIAYYEIFGLPLIVYGGIVTIISLLITASIPILNKKGKTSIPIQWHTRMAIITIVLALIHGLLGVISYI
ncbi:hypothetical protein ACFLRC_00980 [Candidatus Altiarchaeota archaeon]